MGHTLQSNSGPLVSIVMPSYNHGQYIGQAVRSVIEQKYQNWELIIVDNNSNDDTDQVLATMSDQRINIIKINNHGVIAKSRNAGIDASNGSFIAFLDSDDWWHPNKLEKQVAFMLARPELGISGTRLLTYPAGRKIPFPLRATRTITLGRLLKENVFYNSSIVITREAMQAVGRLSEIADNRGVEDYAFWLGILSNGYCGVLLKDVLGYYRIHSSQVSSLDGVFVNFCKVARVIAEYSGTPGFFRAFRSQFNLCEIQYLSGKYQKFSFRLFFEPVRILNKIRTLLRAVVLHLK